MTAARPTRRTTTVTGGSSWTAMPVKKKDPPHKAERPMRISHSKAVMLRLGVGGIGEPRGEGRHLRREEGGRHPNPPVEISANLWRSRGQSVGVQFVSEVGHAQ